MNIKGLDYNTQREQLVLPEYGREIQQLVDYAVSLPERSERQRCAATIIKIMDCMSSEGKNVQDRKRKLWDHLALMSGFKLDIDYPFDITTAAQIATKPQPMAYPMKRIPVRHYGDLIFQSFEMLKQMAPGPQRDELAYLTANQMHRDLVLWSHGLCDGEKVAADLAYYTDGKIELDLRNYKFERVDPEDKDGQRQQQKKQGQSKKKKKK